MINYYDFKVMKKNVLWLVCLLCSMHLLAVDRVSNKEFLHPDRIRYDGSCMTIDGKDVFIYSAAFHYFRCPEELWRNRFQKIKEAGFNTVETYVPWNWHEREMPAGLSETTKFDFSDIKRWLKMAQEEFGFYTIVRPGPFICAEFSGGAYPRWLAKFRPQGYQGLWLRSDVGVSIGLMLFVRHWPMNSLPESRKAGKVLFLSK